MNQKKYIVYDADGKILKTGLCPDFMMAAQAGAGEFVMEGEADDEKDFIEVLSATKKVKPTSGLTINKISMLADGVDTVTISGFFAASEVRINRKMYKNPDSTFEFSVNLPGEYKITCYQKTKLPEVFTVTAS